MKRDKISLLKLHFVKDILAGKTISMNKKNLYKRYTPRDTQVEDFFENAAISLPGKKSVSAISMKPKKVLTKTVKCLFKEFKRLHPLVKISLTVFSRRRPQHILLSSSIKLATIRRLTILTGFWPVKSPQWTGCDFGTTISWHFQR